MGQRNNLRDAERRRQDRAALLQWALVGLVAVFGLVAALLFTEGGGGGAGGGHLNAPAITEPSSAH